MDNLENDIISELSKGPLSTTDLADVIGRSRNIVYRKCIRMKKSGILNSELEPGKRRLFYCPLTGEVLTSDNYDDIMRLIEESDDEDAVLIPFYPNVCVWSLSEKGMNSVQQPK
jgi:hypothetical protein